MCGIFGLYNLQKNKSINISRVETCLNTIIHRGPDDQSFEEITDDLIFGHVRLSIIDLHEGSNQPFCGETGNYWVVFNGEIFNYLEIKTELLTLGHHFKTSSDTEVLLYAYIQWGEDCVQKFNGMWAFSIYDKAKEKLFCSRDRFGVKPFNYAEVDGQFIFASEIKAILAYFPQLKVPNYTVIANYCRSSIGAQIKETWFKDVLRLEPAHNLTIENGKVLIKRYWDYPRKVDKNISFEEAKSKYRDLFLDAVNLRMRSDVPVGFTLSSGIDSSSIVSVLKGKLNKNNNTYTAAFSNTAFSSAEKQNFKEDVEIDEPNLVRRLSNELMLQPTFIEIDYNDYISRMSLIIRHLESGHSSPSVYPLYSIMERASDDVTVLLEGQGADELLAGYISNVLPVYVKQLFLKFSFGQAFRELKSFSKVYSLKSAFMLFVRDFNINWIQKLYYSISGVENWWNAVVS